MRRSLSAVLLALALVMSPAALTGCAPKGTPPVLQAKATATYTVRDVALALDGGYTIAKGFLEATPNVPVATSNKIYATFAVAFDKVGVAAHDLQLIHAGDAAPTSLVEAVSVLTDLSAQLTAIPNQPPALQNALGKVNAALQIAQAILASIKAGHLPSVELSPSLAQVIYS